jgi:hypothetical protein
MLYSKNKFGAAMTSAAGTREIGIYMTLFFEWDLEKGRKNLKTHGVSFDEASTTFGDPLAITIGDPLHSKGEQRYVLIGQSQQNRLLVVVHTERGDRIRIISSRLATKKERCRYEENEE